MNNKTTSQALFFSTIALAFGCTSPQQQVDKPVSETITGGMDRSVLPIKEPIRQTYKELDVRNATAPKRFEVKAPQGAPNVIVVLIDDMGFGVSEAFGGPVTTPTMDKLAQNGLRYNRFHTAALLLQTAWVLLHCERPALYRFDGWVL